MLTTKVYCKFDDCLFNEDSRCKRSAISIHGSLMTYEPICTNYESQYGDIDND